MARISRKTNQRVYVSVGKLGIRFHFFSLLCILISVVTLCSLIEIDARRKFIYIDLSHIKFLRMFPKYQSLAYL